MDLANRLFSLAQTPSKLSLTAYSSIGLLFHSSLIEAKYEVPHFVFVANADGKFSSSAFTQILVILQPTYRSHAIRSGGLYFADSDHALSFFKSSLEAQ